MGTAAINQENAGFSLDDFLKSLKGKGFSIDIDDYIVAAQISNLLSNNNLTLSDAKYSLAAIICRNEEEQQKFYQLFEDYIQKTRRDLEEREAILAEETKKIKTAREDEEAARKRKKLTRLAIIVSAVLVLLLSFLFFFPIVKTEKYLGEEKPILIIGHHTTNDKFHFSVLNDALKGYPHTNKKWAARESIYQKYYKPGYDTTGLKVVWYLGDTIIRNRKEIDYYFENPGKKYITISFIYGNKTKRVYKDSVTICEPSPKIKLDNPIYVNQKAKFTASSNKGKSIAWKVDELDTITKDSVLEYTFTDKGSHSVSCKAQGQLCLHDTENAENFDVKEKESFSIEKKDEGNFKVNVDTSFTKLYYWLLGLGSLFLVCCLLTLFVPYMYSIYENIIKRSYQASNSKKAERYFKDSGFPVFTGDKPPIDIPFYGKERLIKGKNVIRKLGLDLQKKVATEDTKLNLRNTINATIRNFDLITPVYENKNAKRCYLFLIDVSNSKNIQVRLFAFLINHLKKNQVDLDVYYYFRNPLRVFKRDIDDTIDINTLKDRYYQSVLIVFSDGYNFLDSNSPQIYEPVQKEYSYWAKRILVTPVPSLDWSVSEKILASFFNIVAADGSGLLDIFSILQKGSYNQKVIYTKDYNTYEAKFIEFEDIERLEEYMSDSEMFQWICAIAVYPKINWEIILTIGEAINPSLVTYENLLRISRIEWIQSGSFPSRIRLELLKKLTRENEIEVRKTVIRLLELESKNDEDSFSNNERIIQLIFNKFILYSFDPKTFVLYSKEEKEFLRLYQDDKFGDLPLKVYLEGIDPDNEAPWNSLIRKSSTEGVDNLEHYYNTQTDAVPQNVIAKSIKKYLRIASVFFLSLVTALSLIGLTKPDLKMLVSKEMNYPDKYRIIVAIDDCYKSFNPDTIIISDGNGIIYKEAISAKNNIAMRNGFQSILDKELNIELISSKNGRISSTAIIEQPTSNINIKGEHCEPPIQAEFYGREYETYKDILETRTLQTTNITASDITNSVIFKSDVDSAFVYKLCLDLIKKKFPLQEITMTNRFDEVKTAGTRILFEQRKSTKKIITTEEELNARFYNGSRIEIFYFPPSSKAEMEKLRKAIEKSGLKYAAIKTVTENKSELEYDPPREGVFYTRDTNLNKAAASLIKTARSVFNREFIMKSANDIEASKGVLHFLLITKLNVKIHYVQGNPTIKELISKDEELSAVMKIASNENETLIRNDINYFYYKHEEDKSYMLDFAQQFNQDGINFRNVSHKRDLAYGIEIGYDKKYDKCDILTDADIANERLGCYEPCISFFDEQRSVIYFKNSNFRIDNSMVPVLSKIADQLKQFPDFRIVVNSYSNFNEASMIPSIGKSIEDWFFSQGIDRSQIESAKGSNKGYKKQHCFDRCEIWLNRNENSDNTTTGTRKQTNNINNQDAPNKKPAFLYYGNYLKGKWITRYFKNSKDELGYPAVGDEIQSIDDVNIREELIQTEDGNFVNQKSLGILKRNTKVIVAKVISVANNYVWIEYKELPQNANDAQRVPIPDRGKK
jgi:hypothetical protein